MILLDVLGHEADLRRVITLVVVLVDRLAIERLADRRNILLEAAIREQTARLVGRCGRSGQCASAFRDAGKELRNLERIGLLLEELVVERRETGLLRCLLCLTSGKLRLCTRQTRTLRTLAKCRKLLRRARANAVEALTNRLLLLGCLLECCTIDRKSTRLNSSHT